MPGFLNFIRNSYIRLSALSSRPKGKKFVIRRGVNEVSGKFFRDLFIASILTLFLLLILEDFQPGFVFFWFNFNYLIAVVIISGLLALFLSKKSKNDIINS